MSEKNFQTKGQVAMKLYKSGCSLRDIANDLNISEQGVEKRLLEIDPKLQLTRTETNPSNDCIDISRTDETSLSVYGDISQDSR